MSEVEAPQPILHIAIGKAKIKTRITVKNLRRLKIEGGIDLATKNPDPMLDFIADPIVAATVFYWLYQDQFESAGMTEDDVFENADGEVLEQVRSEVDRQMRSFSTFWRMISTEMEALQRGDSDLKDLVEKGMAERQLVPSGLSS